MSAGWQPGDLALCVRGGRINGPPSPTGYPERGALYEAAGVEVYPDGELWLVVTGAPDNIDPDGYSRGPVWIGERFRKIDPHTPDAEDRETIALLTRERIDA